jgi:hypothetical protein
MSNKEKKLTKTMKVLLFAESTYEINLYDVQAFFKYKISANQASQLLSTLRKNNFLKKHKRKYQEHKRRGRIYEYTITNRGLNRCEWLHSLGFDL